MYAFVWERRQNCTCLWGECMLHGVWEVHVGVFTSVAERDKDISV